MKQILTTADHPQKQDNPKIDTVGKKNSIINVFTLLYMIAVIIHPYLLTAQDPGDNCEPGCGFGQTARFISVNGSVGVHKPDGTHIDAKTGTVILPGSTIVTGTAANAELALEDGTKERLSKIVLEPNTRVVLSGGLLCEDLRPKRDAGRLWVRGIEVEMTQGSFQVEIVPEVSANFNKTIDTPNAKIELVRRREESSVFHVNSGGLEKRNRIAVMEHPLVIERISTLLMGRNIQDLDPREKESMRMQGTMVALELGIVDMGFDEFLNHQMIAPAVNAMTGGKSLDKVDEDTKHEVMGMVIMVAMQQNLIDPASLMVYEHPDKNTQVEVKKGTINVRNTLRSYDRNEILAVESGLSSRVKGFNPPTSP